MQGLSSSHAAHDLDQPRTDARDEEVTTFTVTRSKRRYRKRRTAEEAARCKRIKSAYSAAYVDEYNTTLALAVDGRELKQRKAVASSQIGLSLWTHDEKERFFVAVARHGRGNAGAAARAVETKSEVQVAEYLRLLERAAVEYEFAAKPERLVRSVDMPAAAELSLAACGNLEHSADALAYLVKTDEEAIEKQIYGDKWLLRETTTQRKATQTLNDITPSLLTVGLDRVADLEQAVALLNYSQMLQLSCDIFMRPNEPPGSWPEYALEDEEPSMLASALVDLRTLVILRTKMLVGAAIFNAKSRIRGSDVRDATTHVSRESIKMSDVHLAAENLGMARDCAAYWRDLPRRLQLVVMDRIKPASEAEASVADFKSAPVTTQEDRKLTYEEVEEQLSPFIEQTEEELHVAASSQLPQEDKIEDDISEVASSPESSIDQTSETSTRTDSTSGAQKADRGLYDSETAHLELIDQESSQQEEARLLSLLPAHLTGRGEGHYRGSSPMSSIERPRKRRKTAMDLAIEAWRASAADRYIPEWERYGRLIPDSAFDATASRATNARFPATLPPITRADFRGRSWRSRSRSTSSGSSSSQTYGAAGEHSGTQSQGSVGVGSAGRDDGNDRHIDDGDEETDDGEAASNDNTDDAGHHRSPSTGTSRGRGRSRARPDYSNSGFGDLFQQHPILAAGSTRLAGGVDGDDDDDDDDSG